MKNETILRGLHSAGQFTAYRLARLGSDDERLAELLRLAEAGAHAEWREGLRRLGKKPGRPSVREFVDAIRDEARERGVPLVDIVRRNVAIGHLGSKGHAEPAEHAVASVVAMLKAAGGTPEIQRLRKQVKTTCEALSRR